MRTARCVVVIAVLLAPTRVVTATEHQSATPPDWLLVEASTVGLDTTSGQPVVLLRQVETGRVVPIWVGLPEAQAIARALHGVNVPRPMTHDLMESLLLESGATVEDVVVHDLRGGTYFGMIRLRRAGEEALRQVDSRPSDAIALALRVGAPIRVARSVVDSVPDIDFRAPDGADQVVRALGITVVAATPAIRRQFDLDGHPGVVVVAVTGSASDAGLRRGDLITRVGNATPTTPIEFFDAIRAVAPGEPIVLTYRRDGVDTTVSLPFESVPSRPRRDSLQA
jgi:bifunctional DNase/RNase